MLVKEILWDIEAGYDLAAGSGASLSRIWVVWCAGLA